MTVNNVKNEKMAMAAAAAAVVAAGGLYYANKKKMEKNDPDDRKPMMTVLVFRDCGNEVETKAVVDNGLSPNAFVFKYDPTSVLSSASGRGSGQKSNLLMQDLKAAVARQLGEERLVADADEIRLFVQSSKEEIEKDIDSHVLSKLLKSESGTNGLSVPVLICTTGGKELSKKASESLPLRKFPWTTNVTEFPFGLGHIMAFRGKRGNPIIDGYDNLFRANRDTVKSVLMRRFPYRTDDANSQKYYNIDYRPVEDEGLLLNIDPEVVYELLKRQQDFPKMWCSAPERGIMVFVESGGLFTSSTPTREWQTAHGVLPKYFNAIRIKNYYPIVLEKTQVFVREWAKIALGGHVVTEANDWLKCMTSDAVIKASMDYDMRNVERKGSGEPLHQFLVSFRESFESMQKVLKRGQDPDLSQTPDAKQYRRHKAIAKAVVADLVEKTRNREIGGPLSFLTGMLDTKSAITGEYIQMKDFWGHAVNVLIAGHETTAATLGFCLAELSQHPDYMEKAVKEVESVMQGRSSPSYDDIGKLKYLDACFLEALRMYPPAQLVKRECAHDTIIKGNYLLRKGQRIETVLYGMHRDPQQWDQGVFGDVEVFNPDRHLPGGPARHPNAMTPFGFGIRGCIGMQFALLEAKTFLCMILNFFSIKTPPNFEIISQLDGTSPTCKDLSFILRPRPGGPMSRVNLFAESATVAATDPVASPTKKAKASEAADDKKKGSSGGSLLILYGSNSGTSEDLARLLAEKASEEGYESQVLTLDKAVSDGLLPCTTSPVAIITSTYNGMPPDNASNFSKWLASGKGGSQKGMKFAVFGVGNSNWLATYQKFPTEIHRTFLEAGASQMKDLTKIDVSGSGFTETFDDWADDLLAAIGLDLGIAVNKPAAGTKKRTTFIRSVLPQHSIEGEPAANEVALRAKLVDIYTRYCEESKDESLLSQPRYEPCQVTSATQLQSEHSDRSTCHVELLLPSGTTYEAGDHLAIIGCNSEALVNAALKALGMSGEEIVECNPGQTSYYRGYPNDLPGVPLTARLALTWLPDLSAPLSRKDIEHLAEGCACPNFIDTISNLGATLTEALTTYKNLPVDIVEFCAYHPRIKPRYYSISSSPLVKPDRVTITVGLVEYKTKTGQHHRGLASGKVHSLTEGSQILCRVCQLNGNFKLPKDPATPIIMVGPGTGVAPFMGFLEEREVTQKNGKKLGPAHLFFGCRSSSTDFIYKEKLESYTANGVLSTDGLHVAFSREERQSKVYVQDLIAANSEAMWKLIDNSGAVVYICGDARRMAPDVKKAFVYVAAKHGRMSESAAENWMGSLISNGRYIEDVYA